MILDIRRTAIRLRLRGLFTAIIFGLLILALLLIDFLNEIRSYLILGFSIIYLFYILYIYFKDYYYIYFNDESNKILLRYYSLRPLSQAKKSIEIPRGSLSRFEIKTSTLGLNEKIILYLKIKSGVYKYPPVSITALSQQEKNQFIQALNKLL